MSSKLECDCCGANIVRKHGVPSGRVTEGKGTVEFRPSARRRIVSWLLGGVNVLRWGNKSLANVGGEWHKTHLCNDCYERIRKEVADE
jgi:hypothetical protein